ncbi:uncharacterized protein FOMMEDRAFT_31184 [Fomitiporia mediterranea MF3/22]|uniref:uncharacterized protein n=1 Tax=Fomitiporia mediterranea (strain MF3/22) TaxID=694068 RepID=UPI0004407B56|nr:uncharacterized protein FOMMEDRAFT_31184 [Fomitiporia mediterranea MF3/22]EJC99478.1 hypothetical protein FOMMEDRAFT_31184 [Fomitiporia mediterranea MF3/22]
MSQRDVPFQETISHLRLRAKIYPKDIPLEESMLVPLRLSQVCRLWNDLVISCPSLWTDITVLIYKLDSTRRDKWLSSTVDTWIERSRLSPLRLRFECDTSCLTTRGYPYDEPNDDASDVQGPKLEIAALILKNLLDHHHRWRDAFFTFIGPDPGMLPQLGLVDAPLLESLSICWGGFTQYYDMTQLDLDISNSPRLSNLHLTCIPRIITGRVSNLRKLNLNSRQTFTDIDTGRGKQKSVLLEIFRDMPNLEVLDIGVLNCVAGSEVSNPQSSRVTLPKLHTLVVENDDSTIFIISQLILPGLRRLTCKHFPDDVDVLLDMFVRSQASLEYFEIRWTMMIEGRFGPLLRLTPSLKTLCMKHFLWPVRC